MTVGAHSSGAVADLADLAQAIKRTELSDGNRESAWRLLGYEGYRVGRLRYGEQRGWSLMQLSGDLAASYLDPAVNLADRVSRLDLAVTVTTADPYVELGRYAYEGAVNFCSDHPKAARPWFITGVGSGWTTYIGQRESDLFFRCYDKDAESRSEGDPELERQYANAWRYELEIKGDVADQTAKRLVQADDVSRTSNAMVHAYLTQRGVEPPWQPDQPVKPIGTLRRRSDRDRKLAWLVKQVRPTVEWLSQNGDMDSVIAALGLDMRDTSS